MSQHVSLGQNKKRVNFAWLHFQIYLFNWYRKGNRLSGNRRLLLWSAVWLTASMFTKEQQKKRNRRKRVNFLIRKYVAAHKKLPYLTFARGIRVCVYGADKG